MPSVPHELLVQIVSEHPEVVLAMVERAFEIDLGRGCTVEARATNFSDLSPPELRADAVLRVHDPRGLSPTHALVVEIQLAVDEVKRRRWPVYVASLRDRLDCLVTLVIVTLEEKVARWARAPMVLDRIGSAVHAIVLGPHDLPLVVDVEAARRLPELALLGFLAHASEPAALQAGRLVLEASRPLDVVRTKLYTDIVFAHLNAAARATLEAEMQLENYEYQSEFMRNLVARVDAESTGRAIFAVFEARGIAVDAETRDRVLACRDPEQLRVWLTAAVTVADAASIF